MASSLSIKTDSSSEAGLNERSGAATDPSKPRQLPASGTLENLRKSGSVLSLTGVSPSQKMIKDHSRLHKYQVEKVAERNENDIDLSDTIRDYFKKRQEVESSYLKELDKLNKQYLRKVIDLGVLEQKLSTKNGSTAFLARVPVSNSDDATAIQDSGSPLKASAGSISSPSPLVRSNSTASFSGGHRTKQRSSSVSSTRSKAPVVSYASSVVNVNSADQNQSSEAAPSSPSSKADLTNAKVVVATTAMSPKTPIGKSKLSFSFNNLQKFDSPSTPSAPQSPKLSKKEVVLQRSVHIAFHSLLSETEKVIKTRQNTLETTVNNLLDKFRDLAKIKEQNHKKLGEAFVKLQAEVLQEYQDLEKLRKEYDEAYKTYKNAMNKYVEVQSKPKVGLMSLFQSKDGMLDRSKKKLDEAEKILKATRNEYLLQYEIASSAQNLYYQELLPTFLKSVDSDYYKLFATFLDQWNQGFASDAQFALDAFKNVEKCVNLVDREIEIKKFLDDHQKTFGYPGTLPLLTADDDDPHLLFLPAEIKQTYGTSNPLEVLMPLESDLDHCLKNKEKQVHGLQTLRDSFWMNPKFGDVETMVDSETSAINEMNSARFHFIKASSQVKLWSGAVPDNMLLKEKDIKSKEADLKNLISILKNLSPGSELERRRLAATGFLEKAELPSSNAEAARNQLLEIVAPKKEEPVVAKVEAPQYVFSPIIPDDDEIEDAAQMKPLKARALYAYQAATGSELDLSIGDSVQVLEDPSQRNDGWVLCEQNGKKGVIPLSYIALVDENAGAVQENSFNPNKVHNTVSGEQANGSSGHDYESLEKARALYDYSARAEGELTFRTNDVVAIVSRVTESSEWWRAKLIDGTEGNVPVTYVSALNSNDFKQLYLKFDYDNEGNNFHLKTGDLVLVVKQLDENWTEGIHAKSGRYGLIPFAYLQQ